MIIYEYINLRQQPCFISDDGPSLTGRKLRLKTKKLKHGCCLKLIYLFIGIIELSLLLPHCPTQCLNDFFPFTTYTEWRQYAAIHHPATDTSHSIGLKCIVTVKATGRRFSLLIFYSPELSVFAMKLYDVTQVATDVRRVLHKMSIV